MGQILAEAKYENQSPRRNAGFRKEPGNNNSLESQLTPVPWPAYRGEGENAEVFLHTP